MSPEVFIKYFKWSTFYQLINVEQDKVIIAYTAHIISLLTQMTDLQRQNYINLHIPMSIINTKVEELDGQILLGEFEFLTLIP